jgi:hypothetical protein
MRSFRLICALVLAASLAMLPVSASLAMTHTAKADMDMAASGDDCPCCEPAKSPDACFPECCHLQALRIEVLAFAKPPAPQFVVLGAQDCVAIVSGPDPPPPRC